MKLTPWYLVAIAPIAAAGCSGAFLGHCAVLGVTLWIFIGTLTLGRHTGPSSVDPARNAAASVVSESTDRHEAT